MFKQFFSLCALALIALGVSAQTPNLMEVVPADPQVRVGTLDNGIKYYIRANKKDPQRANFHIVYDVGAIQENDKQNGLAHFLEHMAFNGSKHFPDNKLIDYLQTIGVRFGENLNAMTGQEQTTYMITDVPVTRQGIIDTALLILHDWAGFISLKDKDIDEERGVIREEWRQGNTAQRRAMEKQFPVVFNHSIYAQRNVIGDEEVLKTFSYQELKDFYHQWCRPDMQAFVIVGDIDPVAIEAQLKAVMADIVPFEVRTPKEKIVIPENETMMASVVTDPELSANAVELLFRYKAIPAKYNNTILSMKSGMIGSLLEQMLNERFTDIALKANAPFLGAHASYGGFVAGYDALDVEANAKDGELLKTLEALTTELYRMQRGGFSSSEFERAKTKMLSSAENAYNNRNDRRNGQFIDAYMDNFTDNEAIPSAEKQYELIKQILESTTLEEINSVAKNLVRDPASCILVTMPEKEGNPAPTEAQVLGVIEKVKGSEIAIVHDQTVIRPLISEKLKGSAVVKTEQGKFGSTVWTLKNGLKVVVKPTELKTDELRFNATQLGGTSTVTDLGAVYASTFYPQLAAMSGVGDFTTSELSKTLAGKIASCTPAIGTFTQGFSGASSPKDIETMLQLLYLNATAPRFDSTAHAAFINQLATVIPNLAKNPDFIVQDSLSAVLYANNPRTLKLNMNTVSKMTLPAFETLYKQLFRSFSGTTFTFVGNIDPAVLKPLVEKYIGSLPVAKTAAKWGKLDVQPVKGQVTEEFKTPMETGKVTAFVVYNGRIQKEDLPSVLVTRAISDILEIRYTKSIREEAGGTYGVGVQMQTEAAPAPNYLFYVMFNTDPSKIQQLLPIVYKEIADLAANGPKAEDLNKVAENFRKKFEEDNNSNAAWVNYLSHYYTWNEDMYTNYLKYVNALTVESVQREAKALFTQGNVCTVVQLPVETPAKVETPKQ